MSEFVSVYSPNTCILIWNTFRCGSGMDIQEFGSYVRRTLAYDCVLRVGLESCKTYYFRE